MSVFTDTSSHRYGSATGGIGKRTTVDVSASVTARNGRTLLDSRIQGKVHFFGENLGVTHDLAKRIATLLHKNFATKASD